MSATSTKDGQHFPHKTGDVVLVKWRDGKIYFAKIKTIEWSKKRCVVIFDDKSQDLARFSWIHDVNETTTDIICVRCKQDNSDKGNEIVLCDQCGYGYHQKCHETKILQRALEDDSIWICYFCEQEMACPYVTNADALTQSLEGIDNQANKYEKLKPKKRKQSMKISMETSKKYCTGLLANSPCVEQCGEEEAIGEHHTEQNTPISAKAHKTQSRKKPKPYKVEIHSSISKEHFVDEDNLEDREASASLHGKKIKRKSLSQEIANKTPKKSSVDSSGLRESPSGVGIFSFDMPSEYHSNLHQLAMASQLVSQSPSGEVPRSVIKAIECEQKNQQEQKNQNKSPVNNHEKPTSLVLSIPRSPLISISGRQSTSTTPALLQPAVELSTPSCIPAVPSPVIVSNCNSKASSSLKTAFVSSAAPVTQAVPVSPDSVFIYPHPTKGDRDTTVTSQLKKASESTTVRPDSVESNDTFTSSNTTTKTSDPCVVTASTSKPTDSATKSLHPVVHTPATVTQKGAFFECPPPVSVVTKPTSIQFVDKNGTTIRTTTLPPKFTRVASSPIAPPNVAAIAMPTITAASPVVMHSPSTAGIKATPTPITPASTQPVYYVQINGGTPSKPVFVRPIRQQQAQSPVVKIVNGPVSNHTQPVSHGDQIGNHLNGAKTQKPTSHHENTKESHTMYFANQVRDIGSNISMKMGETYSMVSEHSLINKFEEAWKKLNELTAKWQQSASTTAAVAATSKKPVVAKAPQQPSLSSGRPNKLPMIAQPQQQQIVLLQQQQTPQQIPQQQQPTLQQQTITTPVQLVAISTPHQAATPIVQGDMVSILPSPAHMMSTPAHMMSTPNHMISTPVVIPAVARTGSDVTYYNIPPKGSINSAVAAVHPHKTKEEVYVMQVVKPVAPVMPVTPVIPVRNSDKRSAQQCDVCNKKASFLCSGCQSAWYCGRSCQYNAWQEHSHRCNKKS